jgi:nucleoid DNA-binding protein
MNNWQLVQKYATKQGVSQKVAFEQLEALLGVIEEALLEDDSVILKGIGRLIPKELVAKRGVNPKGKAHSQPARLTVRIIPSGIFKAKLNANRGVDRPTPSVAGKDSRAEFISCTSALCPSDARPYEHWSCESLVAFASAATVATVVAMVA